MLQSTIRLPTCRHYGGSRRKKCSRLMENCAASGGVAGWCFLQGYDVGYRSAYWRPRWWIAFSSMRVRSWRRSPVGRSDPLRSRVSHAQDCDTSTIASQQPLLENESACCRRVAQRESTPYTKERPEGSIPFPAYQQSRHLNRRPGASSAGYFCWRRRLYTSSGSDGRPPSSFLKNVKKLSIVRRNVDSSRSDRT